VSAEVTPAANSSAGKPDLLVILGPTASGKTRLAVAAARALGGEIISADSRQVFRRMDIGTGKDSDEYGEIPHHLIDILEPGEEFSVFAFQRYFAAAFEQISSRGRLPILAGGTGLYLDAVLRGYRMHEVPEDPALRSELAVLGMAELQARLTALQPQLHNTTDLLERERLVRAIEIALGEKTAAAESLPQPQLYPLVFGIRVERELLRKRITARLRERLQHGMIEEVAALLAEGIPPERLDAYGLEYRYITLHLTGRLNRNDMYQKLNSAIHDFAKKQETWFRRMEKHGIEIIWLDGGDQLPRLLEEYSRRAA
jgi:tRNA dimethylallyltransferase